MWTLEKRLYSEDWRCNHTENQGVVSACSEWHIQAQNQGVSRACTNMLPLIQR